eukprot:scaffold144_cov94-Skeletonema_dohrnii-CCMP3373.AAC.6
MACDSQRHLRLLFCRGSWFVRQQARTERDGGEIVVIALLHNKIQIGRGRKDIDVKRLLFIIIGNT